MMNLSWDALNTRNSPHKAFDIQNGTLFDWHFGNDRTRFPDMDNVGRAYLSASVVPSEHVRAIFLFY
jgi:hypothetical protein